MGFYLRVVGFASLSAGLGSYLFESSWRILGRPLWGEQDSYHVKGALLLVEYEQGCLRCIEEMCYLLTSQESLATSRPPYAFTGSNPLTGRYEHGFRARATKDKKEQGLNLCGCRSFFQDGTFHPLHQDK